MPLTHIALRAGTSEAYRQAIFDGVYQAMRETFNVPEDDQFMTITEHSAANFRFSRHYLGIERTDEFVMIQIAANNTRTTEQKKALYRRIAERLHENPGLRTEDVFINLVEVAKENWSFGNGIAQYA
jgi:phenylpyruvate tautomerase PptA (4-oxalocrotonate tautomerase family)